MSFYIVGFVLGVKASIRHTFQNSFYNICQNKKESRFIPDSILHFMKKNRYYLSLQRKVLDFDKFI